MNTTMLARRSLLKSALAVSVASLVPGLSLQAGTPDTVAPLLKPKRLASGQTVGLIAPSSNTMENEIIYFAQDILRSFGFKVKPGKYLFERNGYLAGADKQRAADINLMFADPEVDAIICLRGGYGSPRLLPYLDFDLIRSNPKVLVGYSDVTALLNAIFVRTGLVTFHGPIASQNFTDYTLKGFKDVLFNPSPNTIIAQPPEFEATEGQAEKDNRITVINEGVAEGRLIGGNLSLMVKLVGTPFEPSYKNNILFLEDVSEAPYRIDGMLTHLKLAGRLEQLAGIAFGKCTRCRSKGNTLSIEQVLFDHLKPLGIPVVRGVMIGHIKDMATVPLGIKARLDTRSKGITILENAVT